MPPQDQIYTIVTEHTSFNLSGAKSGPRRLLLEQYKGRYGAV